MYPWFHSHMCGVYFHVKEWIHIIPHCQEKEVQRSMVGLDSSRHTWFIVLECIYFRTTTNSTPIFTTILCGRLWFVTFILTNYFLFHHSQTNISINSCETECEICCELIIFFNVTLASFGVTVNDSNSISESVLIYP